MVIDEDAVFVMVPKMDEREPAAVEQGFDQPEQETEPCSVPCDPVALTAFFQEADCVHAAVSDLLIALRQPVDQITAWGLIPFAIVLTRFNTSVRGDTSVEGIRGDRY